VGRPGPAPASPHTCVCFRAWRLEHLASSVSCVVACRSLPATCQRSLDGTPRGAVSNGSGDRRLWPFHGVVAGCARDAMAFARAWVPVLLWLRGVWRASPVQGLAYKPQHRRARLASRPRQRGGRDWSLAVTGGRPVQVGLAFDQKLELRRGDVLLLDSVHYKAGYRDKVMQRERKRTRHCHRHEPKWRGTSPARNLGYQKESRFF
jgi:hypothetical protein